MTISAMQDTELLPDIAHMPNDELLREIELKTEQLRNSAGRAGETKSIEGDSPDGG